MMMMTVMMTICGFSSHGMVGHELRIKFEIDHLIYRIQELNFFFSHTTQFRLETQADEKTAQNALLEVFRLNSDCMVTIFGFLTLSDLGRARQACVPIDRLMAN
jgi:hypothetical protein